MLRKSLKYGGLLYIVLYVITRITTFLVYRQIISHQTSFLQYFQSYYLMLIATALVGIAFYNEKKSIIWMALVIFHGIQLAYSVQEYRSILRLVNFFYDRISLQALWSLLRVLAVFIGLLFIQKTWGKVMIIIGKLLVIIGSVYQVLRYIVFEWFVHSRPLIYTANLFLGTVLVLLLSLLTIGYIMHYEYGDGIVLKAKTSTPEEISFDDF